MILHKFSVEAETDDGYVTIELNVELPFQVAEGAFVYLPKPSMWDDNFETIANIVSFDIEDKCLYVSLFDSPNKATMEFHGSTNAEITEALTPLGYEVHGTKY